MAEAPPAIGIDLGTTYSCVAVYRNGKVDVLPDNGDNRVIPSCVSFTDTAILVGEEAKIEMLLNPKNTVYDSKRLIGRQTSDEMVISDMKMWPFQVISEKNRLKIKVRYKKSDLALYPEQVSSQILSKLKQIAELRLQMNIKDAVITVPAYFNNAQRQATKDAGTVAGLNVLRIINEPTAAALAYGLDKTQSQNVLIYDLGGGTFDVTIFKVEDGVFDVLSTTGDTHLGGQDFTNNLVEYCIGEIKKQHENIIFSDTMIAQLRADCEMAKRALSSALSKTPVHYNHEGKSIQILITKACFEEINKQIFNRTLYYVNKALADAKLEKSDIDEIVLVGGSTRIPKVQNILKECFSGKSLNFTLNPDECVAHGAAIQAALITNCDPGNLKNVTLLDIIPLSLGIKEAGGLMSVIIKRKSKIPTVQKHVYRTRKANQSSALIEIYEGERIMAEDNIKLGQLIIDNLPKDKAGLVKVEIIFSIDVNGILHVSATENTKNNVKTVTIDSGFSRFTDIDLIRMVEQAQIYGDNDLEKKKLAEAENKLESLRLQIESDCAYNVHSISNSSKVIVLLECEAIRSWMEDNLVDSVEEYNEKYRTLKSLYDEHVRKKVL